MNEDSAYWTNNVIFYQSLLIRFAEISRLIFSLRYSFFSYSRTFAIRCKLWNSLIMIIINVQYVNRAFVRIGAWSLNRRKKHEKLVKKFFSYLDFEFASSTSILPMPLEIGMHIAGCLHPIVLPLPSKWQWVYSVENKRFWFNYMIKKYIFFRRK